SWRADSVYRPSRSAAVSRGPFRSGLADRLSHIHAAHSATRHTAVGMLILRSLGHHDLCREHQARDRCRILQREPRNLGRVQYALFKQVAVLTGRRVVPISTLARFHLVQDNRRILARILNDIPQRLFDRARQNADASRLILIGTLQLLERLERSNERNTPARYHAF